MASTARYFWNGTLASWWAPDRHCFYASATVAGVATVLTAIFIANSAKLSNR